MKSNYYLIAIIAFFVSAFFIITYASGYKVDITNRNISQTSMIVIDADQESTVLLDSIIIGKGKQTIRNLVPKSYSLTVEREGYHTWTKNLELEPGEAEIINYAILFKNSPEIEEYKVDQSDFFTKLADKDGIRVTNNEIYQNDNFVTRFSNDVKGVVWYSDRRYIAYTYDKKLKITEIDGENETTLLDKDSDSPAIFLNSGKYVIYENNSKIYRAKLR